MTAKLAAYILGVICLFLAAFGASVLGINMLLLGIAFLALGYLLLA